MGLELPPDKGNQSDDKGESTNRSPPEVISPELFRYTLAKTEALTSEVEVLQRVLEEHHGKVCRLYQRGVELDQRLAEHRSLAAAAIKDIGTSNSELNSLKKSIALHTDVLYQGALYISDLAQNEALLRISGAMSFPAVPLRDSSGPDEALTDLVKFFDCYREMITNVSIDIIAALNSRGGPHRGPFSAIPMHQFVAVGLRDPAEVVSRLMREITSAMAIIEDLDNLRARHDEISEKISLLQGARAKSIRAAQKIRQYEYPKLEDAERSLATDQGITKMQGALAEKSRLLSELLTSLEQPCGIREIAGLTFSERFCQVRNYGDLLFDLFPREATTEVTIQPRIRVFERPEGMVWPTPTWLRKAQPALSQALLLRPLRPSDQNKIPIFDRLVLPEDNVLVPKDIAAYRKQQHIRFWVATHKHDIMGYVVFNSATREIERILVHPEKRLQGIGARLLQKVTTPPDSVGQRPMLAFIPPSETSEEVMRFYSCCGFIAHGALGHGANTTFVMLAKPVVATSAAAKEGT